MGTPHSIYTSIDRHLVVSTFLSIMNNAAMNIHMVISVWTYVFSSLGYILRSGIVESYGSSVQSLSRVRLFVTP